MKKFSYFLTMLLMLCAMINVGWGQTTLSPGDLMIVTINVDGSKNFDFVPLVDLEAGTIINFTDNAWVTANNALNSNEGTLVYTSSGTVIKGTVVSYPGSTGGEWSSGSGSFNPSGSGDNILVYQGSSSLPAFIYGIGWAKSASWSYTGTNDSDIPPTLSEISCTILNLGTADNYQYNTANGVSGTNAEILALLSSISNYNSDDVSAYAALTGTFMVNGSGYSIKGPTNSGDLVITEINDPTESDFSFIEIYNTSSDYMNILECSTIQYNSLIVTTFSSSESNLIVSKRSGTNIRLDGAILIAPKSFLLLIRGDNTTVSVANFESSSYYDRELNNDVLFAWEGTANAGVPQITGDESFEIKNSNNVTIDKTSDGTDTQIKVDGNLETFSNDKRYERINVSGYNWKMYTGDYENATPGSISSDNQTDSSLPVELDGFNAVPGNSKVTLCWTTESETENLGFNLYRSAVKNGEFLMLNAELIQGHGSTSEKHEYSYVDRDVVNGVTYYYKIEDVDYAGKAKMHEIVVTATPSGDEEQTICAGFRLQPCYPNPFNPETTLRFELGDAADVSVQVYDVLGKLVSTLSNSAYPPGEYSLSWNGRDARDRLCATGIYFLQISSSAGFINTQKLIFLR